MDHLQCQRPMLSAKRGVLLLLRGMHVATWHAVPTASGSTGYVAMHAAIWQDFSQFGTGFKNDITRPFPLEGYPLNPPEHKARIPPHSSSELHSPPDRDCRP